METWMWRDGRERHRVWDDHGPSYCIIRQGFGCGSIFVDSVKDSGPQIAREMSADLRNWAPAPLGLEYEERRLF